MKTFIAAALVAFTVSTSAFAFEIPAIDGMPDGVQEMISKQGKQRGAKQQQTRQAQPGGEQQHAGRGNMKDMMNSLISGDTSGIQGLAASLGQ